MKKKADNVVYNYSSKEYDAFRKEYPTSFNSKTFRPEKIKDLKSDAQHYFTTRFFEIKEKYESLLKEIEWSNLIYKSKYNFTPIIGETYHLYKGNKNNFLSIIKPHEWEIECMGSYKLTSNNTWTKTE